MNSDELEYKVKVISFCKSKLRIYSLVLAGDIAWIAKRLLRVAEIISSIPSQVCPM